MKVLVIGGGGREHAIVRALARGSDKPDLLCAPGNAGIARDARCFDVGSEDVDALVRLAVDQSTDLVVVGPETPLVAGIVDALAAENIRAFGPSGAAAQIEGSKAFAKELMKEAGIPTAGHVVFSSYEQAEAQMDRASYPAVLKADGLAAGKGVVICQNPNEARAALQEFFIDRRFGDAADRVVLEEFLMGDELSLLALCDGENVLPMAPAQDFKRIGEADTGPNTGGMGSYSPVPGIDQQQVDEIVRTIHQPIVDRMKARGTPYHGVLYAGLMLTASGPQVLEFNCRFGDPETQAVLPRLRSDLLSVLDRSIDPGGLAAAQLEWSGDWAVTVVMASAGYPASSRKGDVIRGLENVEAVELTHAGTAEQSGEIVTAGGRVLNVTALGSTVAQARDRAYRAVEQISFDGAQYRRDIAAKVAEQSII